MRCMPGKNVSKQMGHSRKHPYHPHGGNWRLTPTPFGCPNTFTIIRNNFVSPPPPDGRNFLREGSVDHFLNNPILGKVYLENVSSLSTSPGIHFTLWETWLTRHPVWVKWDTRLPAKHASPVFMWSEIILCTKLLWSRTGLI